MTSFAPKPHLGGYMVIKTAGQTAPGPAIATQTNIAILNGTESNPNNNVYPGLANGAAGSMNIIKGGRAPVTAVTTAAHPTWFTAANLDDWIGGKATYLDTNLDCSAYSCDLYEPITGHHIYDTSKCQSIVISYNAAGGGVMVEMVWPALYGPGESGTSPTFGAYVAQYGQCYNRGDVQITGFDQDQNFVLALVRAQGRQYLNPTSGTTTPLNGIAMTSHGVGGALGIVQNQTYTSIPSTTCTIQIGPVTTGVKFTLYVNPDSNGQTWPGSAPGQHIAQYSLVDGTNANTGTNAGYPFVIAIGT